MNTSVVIRLADGTERATVLDQWGEYECPWCHYVVCSPDGHAERQRHSHEYADRNGEPWAPRPYPEYERAVWEARGCSNPACVAGMTLPRLEAHRLAQAEADAERERRAGIARWHANYMAETAAREEQAWAVIRDQATAAGQCLDCLRSSYWQTRPHLVRHRSPGNCPHQRRHAA